jgi:hypothetical protein
MVPYTTYGLVDLTDHSFLNWNLEFWMTAVNVRQDYMVNLQNIAIVKIQNRKVVKEMSPNANRPTYKPKVDLARAQKQYPLR